MGRDKKRRRTAQVVTEESFPSYNVPTLKEYAWECLSSVLHQHSTVSLVSLTNKPGCDSAMKKFWCVNVLAFLEVSIHLYLVLEFDWTGSLLCRRWIPKLGRVFVKQRLQRNSVMWHSLWHMLCLILVSFFFFEGGGICNGV